MSGIATNKPPATLPSKMATNVPISVMPLPPVSSCSSSTRGKYEYLAGPNTVECRPIKKVQANSTAACWVIKPTAASSMMAISQFFTHRMMVVSEYFSASCPLVAENNK